MKITINIIFKFRINLFVEKNILKEMEWLGVSNDSKNLIRLMLNRDENKRMSS